MATPPIPPDDPRVRFAAERTLLAWIRTGLSMMGFGFVVARFGLFLHEMTTARHELGSHPTDLTPQQGSVSVWIGTFLVLLGVTVTSYAAAHHWRAIDRLERGETLPRTHSRAVVILAVILALLGLFVAAHLAFVTH